MIKIIALMIFFLPLSVFAEKKDFIVAVDIGHSKQIQGATSSRGIREYKFNKIIADQLLIELKNRGFSQSFIVSKRKGRLRLSERTHIAKNKKADIFISIHHDSVQEHYLSYWKFKGKKNHYSDKFNGYSIFISNKNKRYDHSLKLARHIGNVLQTDSFIRTLHHAEKIKGENRRLVDSDKGVYEFNDLIVLKTAKMPAVLFECGVIVNRDEELLLISKSYQQRMVKSMANGIHAYYLDI